MHSRSQPDGVRGAVTLARLTRREGHPRRDPARRAARPPRTRSRPGRGEAGRRLRARELSATELTRAALERIGARNAALNAFITVASDDALRAAAAADARLAAGTAAGPLDGIPVAVKDVIATACVRTTAASRILADFVPPYDATVTARLKAAGAIIVGKTNCDEF